MNAPISDPVRAGRLRAAARLTTAVGAFLSIGMVVSAPAFASAGAITDFAGTGVAGAPTSGPAAGSKLNGPQDLTIDTWGNVYIADTSN